MPQNDEPAGDTSNEQDAETTSTEAEAQEPPTAQRVRLGASISGPGWW